MISRIAPVFRRRYFSFISSSLISMPPWRQMLLVVGVALLLSGCAAVWVAPMQGFSALVIALALVLGACRDNAKVAVNQSSATLDIAPASAFEADGTITFTVTRSGNTSAASSVDYATSDGTAAAGTDYTAASGTLDFAADVASLTIPVTLAADDTTFERATTLTVTLSNVVSGVLGTASARGLIHNDEPLLLLSAISGGSGANGSAMNGVLAGDQASRVHSAGDFNGDGIADLIIGAPYADPAARTSAGTAYVVFGSAAGFGANFELSALNGTNGFAMEGLVAGDKVGTSVSGAGDVNGDGLDDIIIGADGTNALTGTSYVVFGAASGIPAIFNLATLNGANGFAINGVAAGDKAGFSVNGAGDVNGDGFADVVIGAFSNDTSGVDAGAGYVVFGAASGLPAALNLSALTGANGFAITGVAAGDFAGRSVSGAGDMNGDGIDDVIIGANRADPVFADAGAGYVVFGAASFSAVLPASTLTGANGFAINGAAASDNSGSAVSGVGDFNGDGIDDVIISSPSADPGGVASAGTSYVVFGAASFPAALALSALNGTNGVAMEGTTIGNTAGKSLSGAGDMNGDGFTDVIIGNYYSSPVTGTYAGTTYVVFGGASFGPTLPLAALSGTDGFTVIGGSGIDYAGSTVSSAGDVNGDGFADVIVGAYGADPGARSGAGIGYVIFGPF